MSFSQNGIKIVGTKDRLTINDSCIFSHDTVYPSQFKDMCSILGNSVLIKVKVKKRRELFLFKNMGIELTYAWKSYIGPPSIAVYFEPDTASGRFYGKEKYAAMGIFHGSLNLFGVDISNRTTAQDLMDNPIFSSYFKSPDSEKRPWIYIKDQKVKYNIYFQSLEKNAKVTCVLMEYFFK